MSKQPVYGYPCVSDPNDFSLDRECCSPAEIAAWQRACETYGRPDYEPNKGCYTERSEDGQLVKHVLRTSWGIGVNLIASCDGCGEPGDDFMVCHECHEQEFCSVCWRKHERDHEDGR